MSPSRHTPNVCFTALLLLLLGINLSACEALATALPQPGTRVVVNLPGENGETPLEGSVIYGSVLVTARAGDAREASFYLDDPAAAGEPVLVSSTPPLRLTLDTRTLTDGPHTLTLRLVAQEGESSLSQIPFTVDNEAFKMLQAVNDLRAGGQNCGTEGVFGSAPALRLESHLMRAAQRQADDMNTNDFLSHTGSDGSTVANRVDDTGYGWSRVGENLAAGQETVTEVVRDWAGSDGHCANLMQPDFTELGVGRAGTYWAQVFAQPR